MKRKILLFVAIAAFAVTGIMTVASAKKAQADEDCPNGCLIVQGPGCYCYQWYDNLKEGPSKPE